MSLFYLDVLAQLANHATCCYMLILWEVPGDWIPVSDFLGKVLPRTSAEITCELRSQEEVDDSCPVAAVRSHVKRDTRLVIRLSCSFAGTSELLRCWDFEPARSLMALRVCF